MTRVSPSLRAAVMERDRRCVLYELDPEHVKDDLRMGVRAPSDLSHVVAMCWAGNLAPPSKVQRAAIRAYLAEVIR